jgi:hypothetical protein
VLHMSRKKLQWLVIFNDCKAASCNRITTTQRCHHPSSLGGGGIRQYLTECSTLMLSPALLASIGLDWRSSCPCRERIGMLSRLVHRPKQRPQVPQTMTSSSISNESPSKTRIIPQQNASKPCGCICLMCRLAAQMTPGQPSMQENGYHCTRSDCK